jgi:hypothetical protein
VTSNTQAKKSYSFFDKVEDAENAAKVAGEPGFQNFRRVHRPELTYLHPPCSREERERKGSGEEDSETDDLINGS